MTPDCFVHEITSCGLPACFDSKSAHTISRTGYSRHHSPVAYKTRALVYRKLCIISNSFSKEEVTVLDQCELEFVMLKSAGSSWPHAPRLRVPRYCSISFSFAFYPHTCAFTTFIGKGHAMCSLVFDSSCLPLQMM